MTYGAISGCPSAANSLYPTDRKLGPTGAAVRTFTFTYDCPSGLLKTETDVDNQDSKELFYDVLGRQTRQAEKTGASTELRAATTGYFDSTRITVARRDVVTLNDGKAAEVKRFDELGRLTLQRTTDETGAVPSESNSAGIKTERRYMVTAGSSCGLPEKSRWELVSNPYRSASSTDAEVPALLETKGWTRLRYDALGRMTHSTSFTGPALPCPWGSNATTSGQTVTVYDADQRTVTDPAQKAIRHRTDALGRVVEVVEDPGGLNYITGYTYDVLDNLTGVTQDRVSPAATQSRSFVYSSLSRLTQATNPETKPDAQAHSTSYVYTNNGQLFSRTDGRGVTTTMTYDALDRVLTRSYSDGTPGVSYSYDTCANGKGRLCQVSNSASTTQYTYDDLGRIVTSKQVMGTPEYAFAYEYNLADNLTKLTYPSGREVLTGYAQNGRAVQLQGRPSATGTLVSYANNAVYWAHGAAARMDMEAGTRKQEWCFNARLQMVGMRVGTEASAQPNCAYVAGSDQIHLSYGYGSSNNGNVQSQTIFPLGATQIYDYDNVNRLKQVLEGANVENYGYDRWGNRWVSGRAGTLPAVPTGVPVGEGSYLTNNRIGPGSACGPMGVYDCAGNLRDLLGTTADYDGENRVKSAVKGGTTVAYAYDGDGRRVKSTVGAVSTVFVYTAFGQLAAEYGAGPAEGRKYLYADALGSTRLESCAGCAQTVKRFDYLPFGEEMSTSSRTAGLGYGLSGSERVKFTGKERDVETGLDYFGARYFSGGMGRFTSPDKPFADQHIENPQSWNLYTYTLNNPLRYVDPNGEGVVEGAARWVNRTGGAFVSLVLEPERVIPAVAGNIWHAVTHPSNTMSAIGTGLTNFANASLDDKVTTLTEVSLDLGTAALTGGASRGTAIGTTLKELPILANAQNAAEALAAKTGKQTAMVGAAYDLKTGAVAVGKSGGIPGAVNPQVANRAAPLGGIGAQVPGVKGKVGNCFECSTANQLANQGSNLTNVRHTQGIRPRNSAQFPKCSNCEVMFPEH